MKNLVVQVNAETGERIEREATADELANMKLVAKQAADAQAELEAREQLRQSAISKLVAGQPLTTAEAELLVIR